MKEQRRDPKAKADGGRVRENKKKEERESKREGDSK